MAHVIRNGSDGRQTAAQYNAPACNENTLCRTDRHMLAMQLNAYADRPRSVKPLTRVAHVAAWVAVILVGYFAMTVTDLPTQRNEAVLITVSTNEALR